VVTKTRWVWVSAIAIAVIVRVIAAEPNLAGTWTLGIEGDHVIPMAMVVTQDGTKLTGTIAMPTNHQGDRKDIPFEGELKGAELKFTTTQGKPILEFTGTVNDDGSLSGSVSMGPNAMKWTAEKLKERKKP